MGGSKKLTELTKVNAVGNQSLFYVVDSTRAEGDQSIGINKSDLIGSLTSGTTVLTGGMVWVSGLTYKSQNLSYSINGNVFNITNGTQVTLDAAPTTPTFQRIDLIYGDINGNILVSKGTESATPTANTLAFDELQLTLALLDTNATEPEGVANEIVYTENAGEPTEWDATTASPNFDLASALAPITGTVSIEAINPLVSGNQINITTSTPITIADFQRLEFKIKLKAAATNQGFIFLIRSGTTNAFYFYLSDFIDINDTTNVQEINVFKNQMQDSGSSLTTFDTVFLYNYDAGTEFILDDIYISTDEGQSEPVQQYVKLVGDTMTGALEVPADAYGAGWNGSNEVPTKNDVYDKIESIGGNDVLVENATVTGSYDIDWDNDTWNLTLTGNTTLTESNLPTSGTNSKVITLYVTGNFSLTYPANWATNKIGTYDGTVDNQIIVEYIKSGEYWLTINQPD